MNYHQRLEKVIDFIGQHLDEEISLESLSDIAHISKFHFHRLFTASTGLSTRHFHALLKKRAELAQVNIDVVLADLSGNSRRIACLNS